MTNLRDLPVSQLRLLAKHLLWKCDRFHAAARWLLLICCLEAVVIVCLILR